MEPSGQAPLKGANTSEVWSILDELPANPFSLNDALAVELATEGAGSYDLTAAALEADRTCEWYDLSARGEAESSMEELEISAIAPFSSCVELEVKPNDAKR
jgi:hypothetical protein